MLQRLRIVLWALIAVIVAVVGLAAAGVPIPGISASRPALPLAAAVGGPFDLAATTGGRVSDRSLAGKPFALFFGYTYCPDVCPTTLLELTNAIKSLGADADRMSYVFVSVDPGRDTIEQLKLYLSSFDARIVGATGTEAEIAEVARKYRAIYEKVPSKDGYTINHTASTYLMDGQGRFVGTFNFQEKDEVILAKLKRLITGG